MKHRFRSVLCSYEWSNQPLQASVYKHKSYFLIYIFFISFLISLLVCVCNFTTRHQRAGSHHCLPRSHHRDWQCLNLPSHFFFHLLAAADWSRSLSNKQGLSAHFQAQALPARLSWANDRLLSLCLCAGKLLCFVNSLPLFEDQTAEIARLLSSLICRICLRLRWNDLQLNMKKV